MFGGRRALVALSQKYQTFQRTLDCPCDSARASVGFVCRTFGGKGVEDDQVDDFNLELELVFGNQAESPPILLGPGKQASRGILNAADLEQASLVAKGHLYSETENPLRINSLSHVDVAGKAVMVNVVYKNDSKRVAVASGKVFLGLEAFTLVAANNIAKGDVLTVAKIAGIHGAKQTSSLIPLCHSILLRGVDATLTLDEVMHAIDIRAEATASGPTGVEMEALTAVTIASLTVYDMCKAVSKDIRISNAQLESKMGGKSGDWYR